MINDIMYVIRWCRYPALNIPMTDLAFPWCAPQIKDHPLFHLIRARIQKREDQVQEGIQSLHTAIQLAGLTSKLVRGSVSNT